MRLISFDATSISELGRGISPILVFTTEKAKHCLSIFLIWDSHWKELLASLAAHSIKLRVDFRHLVFRDIEAPRTNELLRNPEFLDVRLGYVDAVIQPNMLRDIEKQTVSIQGNNLQNDLHLELAICADNSPLGNEADYLVANSQG